MAGVKEFAMPRYYDHLESRDPRDRDAAMAVQLPAAIRRAKSAPALARLLGDIDPRVVTGRAALAQLPVVRKADLSEAQKISPPFGGYMTRFAAEFDHVFQSPGPIYEPGRREGAHASALRLLSDWASWC